jgi:hypothetical protein
VSAYDKDRDGREGYFSLEHYSVFNERPIDLVHVQTMLLQYSAEHQAVGPKQGGKEEGEGGGGGRDTQEITRHDMTLLPFIRGKHIQHFYLPILYISVKTKT